MLRGLTTGSDHLLGEKIAALFAAQRTSDRPAGAILSQVQDLLGSDTALLVPLRDLLQRPAYRQLHDHGGAAASRSQLLAGRDALLQDLASTYQPAVLARLAAVIDGSLALPPGPPPSLIASASAAAGSGSAYGAAAVDPRSAAPGWSGPWSQAAPVPPGAGMPHAMPHSQPPSGQGPPQPPYGQPASAPPPVSPQPAPVASGPSPVTALLIALVSLLSGAVLLALGWLLFSGRPQALNPGAPGTTASPAPSVPSTAAPSPTPSPAPAPTPKNHSPDQQPETAAGAWGSASDYKFGQLPGGAHPNSCAFSVTDANGRTTTDKSRIEYWACRDVGGNPETGYRVVWADGKETNYTFQAGGEGQVVGTNGSTYPMRWRNDTHQGDPIVVINHQDGAVTWIPGQIN